MHISARQMSSDKRKTEKRYDKYSKMIGYITLTRESLRRSLNATDELIESAQDYGPFVPKKFLMFWF